MESSFPFSWLAAVVLTAVSGTPQPAERCHEQPLAQLAATLEEGMPAAEVLARFEAYEARFGPSRGGVAVLGDIRPRTGRAHRILFLHDLWNDRVLALTTWFDGSGTTREVTFRCGRDSGGD